MRTARTARIVAALSAFLAAAAFMLSIALPTEFAAVCWAAGSLLLVTALTFAIVGFRATTTSTSKTP